MAHKLTIHHPASSDAVFASKRALEFRIKIIHCDRREKSQMPKVHGKERNIAAVHHAGSGKQRAIATKNDYEISAVGQLFARDKMLNTRILCCLFVTDILKAA